MTSGVNRHIVEPISTTDSMKSWRANPRAEHYHRFLNFRLAVIQVVAELVPLYPSGIVNPSDP